MRDNFAYTALLVLIACCFALLACYLSFTFGTFLKDTNIQDIASLIQNLP